MKHPKHAARLRPGRPRKGAPRVPISPEGLRVRRRLIGLSLDAVARGLGVRGVVVGRATVHGWESGATHSLTVDCGKALASIYSCRVVDLAEAPLVVVQERAP